jgi:hypothetical protein
VVVIFLKNTTRISIHQELASLVNIVDLPFALAECHTICLISLIISALKVIMIRMAQDTQYLLPAKLGIDGANSTTPTNASMSPSSTPHQLIFTLPAALLLALTCVTSVILPLATSLPHSPASAYSAPQSLEPLGSPSSTAASAIQTCGGTQSL